MSDRVSKSLIINLVSDFMNINPWYLRTASQNDPYPDARKFIAFHLFEAGYSIEEIARELDKDERTIESAIQKHKDNMEHDLFYQKRFAGLHMNLKSEVQ